MNQDEISAIDFYHGDEFLAYCECGNCWLCIDCTHYLDEQLEAA